MIPWNDNKVIRTLTIYVCLIALAVSGTFIILHLSGNLPNATVSYSNVSLLDQVAAIPEDSGPKVTHLATPIPLKAVYLSSWAAGSSKFRQELYNLVDETEVNAVVIDIKDYTGHISFAVKDPDLVKIGSAEARIPDIVEFISKLHGKGVYVIGRISSFEDSYLINVHPEWAVKTESGAIWKDFKGVKWLDAGAVPVWDYLVAIGNEAYSDGFDELNFDYIRFPSDGNMQDIAYSWNNGRPRNEVMRDFFSYLHAKFSNSGIPISADFFGLTTSASGDLGIGQILSDALLNFDYVSPMVYPSHFSNGFLNLDSPAAHPYEVVKYSMDEAVEKALAASTSPDKLRPWLQAFDLGAIYTPDMVKAQVQATYDSGLTSWMLWNAGGVYNKEFFLPKQISVLQ